MFERFVEFYDIFGWDNGGSEARRRRTAEWIRNKKPRQENQVAWHELFGKMTLEQIVHDINTVWIDPAYKLVLGTRRVKEVTITKKR